MPRKDSASERRFGVPFQVRAARTTSHPLRSGWDGLPPSLRWPMLRPWLLAWLLLPSALIPGGESCGSEPARLPKEAPDLAQVQRLIQQLGERKFDQRAAASRQLEKIGPPALAA